VFAWKIFMLEPDNVNPRSRIGPSARKNQVSFDCV
jgi:hypothetical protein